MARVSPIINSFIAGEVSPKIYGRTDLERYASGCKTLTNCLVAPHGGAYYRGGTVFVAEAKYSNRKVRLIEFEFSIEQAYMIEFGHYYLRFYKDGGQLRNVGSISGITQANPAVVTEVGHGRLTGDVVDISGVSGMTEINGQSSAITFLTPDTYELDTIDSTGYTPYSSGGQADGPYTIASPFGEDDLFDVQFAQSNDVMWLVHQSYMPQRLSRTADTSWTISDESFTDGPYNPQNTNENRLLTVPAGNKGDSLTLTASGFSPFNANFVGRMVRMEDPADPANNTWGTITAVASSTSATIQMGKDVPGSLASTAVSTWRWGAFSADSGYPRVVTLFEQRLWFGSTPEKPQTFWGSVIDDYTRNRIGVNADDAIVYTLASKTSNAVQWIEGIDELLTGTQGAEWRVTGGQTGITPTNKMAKRQTSRGNDPIQPVFAGNALLHVQRAGHKIRELIYDDNLSGYKSTDITIISEHLLRTNTVVDLAYQEERNSIVWVVRDDGDLLGLTYEASQNVVAWHHHTTPGTFKSVAVVPTLTHDQVWFAVERVINGQTKVFIEYLDEFNDTSDYDRYHVDCGLKYNGSAITTVSGLDHLVGETVKILADGAVHPDRTVGAGGVVTLDWEASIIHIGLGYNGTIELLDADAGAQNGTSQAKLKRWSDVRVRFYKSAGFKINDQDAVLRKAAYNMDEAIPLFSGFYEVETLGWDKAGTVKIEQDQPLPMNVLAVTGMLTTSDS